MTVRPRLVALALVALLPPVVKPALYRRIFGYRIGRGVRIGITVLDAKVCQIGDDTTIGHFNAVIGVGCLTIGDHVSIGTLNVIRGGDEVNLGRWSQVIRRNELNSIVGADPVNPCDPRLLIGAGSVVTDGHRLDFTDRIELGERVIIGGRNTSLWTHNRQRTAPISIGARTYVGSESRMAPGSILPARCIVALGSVVSGTLEGTESLIGGTPAKVLRPLDERDRDLIDRPTRDGLPENL
jgi:carbonic anhydrase/acetyltransferase-like protein (isoleucine patch superfamily)